MAIFREIPKCVYCGKPIAKAIYRNISGVPFGMQMVGDNFIRWEFLEHDCKRDKISITPTSVNKKLIKYFENFNKQNKN